MFSEALFTILTNAANTFKTRIGCCGQILILSQLAMVVASVTLAIIGATADDERKADIPVFFTGFILGLINAMHIIFKIAMVSEGQDGTWRDRHELMRLHKSAKLWITTTLVGLLWCGAGSVLTTFYPDSISNGETSYMRIAVIKGLPWCHNISLFYFSAASCVMLRCCVEQTIDNDQVSIVNQMHTDPENATSKPDDFKTKF